MIRLIIDTNIIISALLKSKKIKDLLMKEDRISLFTPAYTYFEILRHYDKISKYTDFSERDLWFAITQVLPKRIRICGEYVYFDKIPEAYEIARQFDESDTPFIALSLKLNAPIWTGDKEMIKYGLKSGKYLVLDTEAVEKLAKGKKLEEVLEDLKKRYLGQI
ncbi:Nucleotide-binding protein, PIN domain protein [Ferroglobus placidus DSM 10642]|uniref:Nucleotide-binding protein, PIN domain protein n=1 Tax=Ferroglobus placidus (strain DSM 10642 / AEDII12DO) TaxID=589924 RepID=D3S232_FERPA|nr:PIN domain-containing protein [Ferroglobus placidus]ADC66523.1 Nucleotide-binding protein, PIN domain protein [Ferroglobus placidus DSM 10642]